MSSDSVLVEDAAEVAVSLGNSPSSSLNPADAGVSAGLSEIAPTDKPEALETEAPPTPSAVTSSPQAGPVGSSPSPSATPSSPSSVAGKASSKSKKKKAQVTVTVTMATAATAQNSSMGAQGENTGRWTAEEHRLFLQGLEQHGKGWKKIASLIKSRTVVQIRTHAQKYFQKLAKARQNGEEGEVAMEGRGGTATVPTVTSSAAQPSKRRRQTSGTKRKAIQSVVSSAIREGKKIASAQAAAGVPNPTPPLPAVAPALAPYVHPPAPLQPQHPTSMGTTVSCVPSITTAQGTISGPALEDSL
jgi:SHAQKYF class myb-like DNA-binding protein